MQGLGHALDTGRDCSSEHYSGLSAEATKLKLILGNSLKSNIAAKFRGQNSSSMFIYRFSGSSIHVDSSKRCRTGAGSCLSSVVLGPSCKLGWYRCVVGVTALESQAPPIWGHWAPQIWSSAEGSILAIKWKNWPPPAPQICWLVLRFRRQQLGCMQLMQGRLGLYLG